MTDSSARERLSELLGENEVLSAVTLALGVLVAFFVPVGEFEDRVMLWLNVGVTLGWVYRRYAPADAGDAFEFGWAVVGTALTVPAYAWLFSLGRPFLVGDLASIGAFLGTVSVQYAVGWLFGRAVGSAA